MFKVAKVHLAAAVAADRCEFAVTDIGPGAKVHAALRSSTEIGSGISAVQAAAAGSRHSAGDAHKGMGRWDLCIDPCEHFRHVNACPSS